MSGRCGACNGTPTWRITRHGDAVVSWACAEDLWIVCGSMQREFERTELVVCLANGVDWDAINRLLIGTRVMR